MLKKAHGNRCGHDPAAPRLDSARVIQKNLPPVLTRAAAAWRKKYYFNPYYDGFTHIGRRHVGQGNERQTRSERREAQAAAIAVMIERMDLSTQKVRASTEKLQDESGLTESRFNRALRDLQKAGLIKTTRKIIKEGEAFITHVTHVVTISAFAVIGFTDFIKKQIDKARTRAQSAAEKFKEQNTSGFRKASSRARAGALANELMSKFKKPGAAAPKTAAPEATVQAKAKNTNADYEAAAELVRRGYSFAQIKEMRRQQSL